MIKNKANNNSSAHLIEPIFSPEEIKDGSKYGLSKIDHDLYKEEDDKVEKVIRAKHFNLPNKGDRWKIFEDNKIVCIIEGNKLNKKEKDFLKSVEGITWLLAEAKSGIKSFHSLKKNLKNKLNKIKKTLSSKYK